MKKILLLAALLYLVVAPFTYHPDTKLTLLYASLDGGRVWDIYSFLDKNKLNVPDFHYPPLNFWLLKAEWPLVRLLGGSGIEGWLRMGSNESVTSPNVYTFNLASKAPLLLMLLVAGWILYMIVRKNGGGESKARWVAVLWLFNPVTIYSGVMMGQNDVLAILPFLIGIFWYYDRPWLAFLFFGIGSSVKTFPLIWSLMLAFAYPSKSFLKKLSLALIPILVYGLTILPFVRFSYFREAVLNSGLATRMFAAGIDIGFNDRILIIPLLLSVTLMLAMGRSLTLKVSGMAKLLLVTNLIILGFSHFHPQWAIWLVPFWSIWLVMATIEKDISHRMIISLATLLAFATITLLFDDKFLYWGILASSNPGLLNLPFVGEFLTARGFGSGLINNLAHSLIAGVSLVLLASGVDNKSDIDWSKIMGKQTVLNKLLLAVMLLLIVSTLIFIPKFLPSISFRENGNANSQFRRMDEDHSYAQSWLAKGENLSRVEILMKNPGLVSKDTFQIVIRDEENNLITKRDGSAANIGDPAYFRVDWPSIANSNNKHYSVEISPLKIDGRLEIAFNNNGEIVFREYYQRGSNLWRALSETATTELGLVTKQPLIGILPLICLILL